MRWVENVTYCGKREMHVIILQENLQEGENMGELTVDDMINCGCFQVF